MVRYRLQPHTIHEHLLAVEVHIPAAYCTHATPIVLRWPTWIPGSYMIREYARHVVQGSARCNGNAVPMEKTGKDTWAITHHADGHTGSVVATFIVYAFDLSVRGAFLDATRLYFNGAAVFPEVVGARGPITLEVIAEPASTWRVATTLPAFLVDANGFGSYRADDYDALLDHPFECGTFERLEFMVAHVPHAVVVTGTHKADLARIARDTQRICAQHIKMFHAEGVPPFKRYLFLLNVLADGYGGLEHRDSTSLTCSRNDVPSLGDPAISEGYLSLLGLISHEYFHAWNVKRIRPAAFVPYDLTREALTPQLWVYEGFTSYYDDLALVRAGLITREDYLRLIGRNLTALARQPGRAIQSVAQASADAWIKYYRADENAANAQTSYYLKGGLVALLLDLTLRTHTPHSLDTVFARLWTEFTAANVQAGHYAGTTDDAVATHLQALTGQPWAAWLTHYVYGTAPLPLEAALTEMGIRTRWRTATSSKDRGGLAAAAPLGPNALAVGFSLFEGGEPKVRTVFSGGAAAAGGLSSGDTLVAIDGLRVTAAGLDDLLVRYRVGEAMQVHVFRNGTLTTLTLTVPPAAHNTAWCEWSEDASDTHKAQCARWLGGP